MRFARGPRRGGARRGLRRAVVLGPEGGEIKRMWGPAWAPRTGSGGAPVGPAGGPGACRRLRHAATGNRPAAARGDRAVRAPWFCPLRPLRPLPGRPLERVHAQGPWSGPRRVQARPSEAPAAAQAVAPGLLAGVHRPRRARLSRLALVRHHPAAPGHSRPSNPTWQRCSRNRKRLDDGVEQLLAQAPGIVRHRSGRWPAPRTRRHRGGPPRRANAAWPAGGPPPRPATRHPTSWPRRSLMALKPSRSSR